MLRIAAFILCLLIMESCSDDNSFDFSTSSSIIYNLRAFDVANYGNASDIYLRLQLSQNTNAEELRIYLVKTQDVGRFKAEFRSNSSAYDYMPLAATPGKTYALRLAFDLNTYNNENISIDTPYQIFIGLGDDKLTQLSEDNTPVVLTNVHPLEGQYKGLWQDGLDGLIPVSMELFAVEDSLFGSFYYSNRFESCCGGINDGSVKMYIPPPGDTLIGLSSNILIGDLLVEIPGDTAISRGDTITGFSFNQELLEFTNDITCIGTYNGVGSIDEFIRLSLTYSGSDCLGTHAGTLVVDKQ